MGSLLPPFCAAEAGTEADTEASEAKDRPILLLTSQRNKLLVASLPLVVRPGAPFVAFLFLVAMPFAPSSLILFDIVKLSELPRLVVPLARILRAEIDEAVPSKRPQAQAERLTLESVEHWWNKQGGIMKYTTL